MNWKCMLGTSQHSWGKKLDTLQECTGMNGVQKGKVWYAVQVRHDRLLGHSKTFGVYRDAMGRQQKMYFLFLSSHFFCFSYPWYPSFSFLLLLLLLFLRRFYFVLICVCVCLCLFVSVCVCVSVYYVCSGIVEARRGPWSLQLELQTVVTNSTWYWELD